MIVLPTLMGYNGARMGRTMNPMTSWSYLMFPITSGCNHGSSWKYVYWDIMGYDPQFLGDLSTKIGIWPYI